MSDGDAAKLCRVGYALNAKKLRRAATAAANDEQPQPLQPQPQPQQPQQQDSRQSSPWRGGGLADILELEPSAGELVQFIPWDHEAPAQSQPDFHVIIHKLTEDIDRIESSSKLQALEQYLAQHPSTVIVDPIASVRKVVSRARTCFHLQSIENRLGSQCPFRQPTFLVVGQCSDSELLTEIRAKNISFPLICKPIEACGTPHSHHMVVVLSDKDVAMIPRDCIVQQYHDHGGHFFKVYVIDDRVCAYVRPSLPNLHGNASSCHSIVFDSRYCYPTLETFQAPAASPLRGDKLWQPQGGPASPLPAPPAPPLDGLVGENEDVCSSSSAVFDSLRTQLQHTADALKAEFELSLFGFDVILPVASEPADRRPMVIDVNYFPSYKEVADFPSRLRKYLRSLAFRDEPPGSVAR